MDNNEITDFKTSHDRLKGQKGFERRKIWKYVKWVFWFLVVAFIVSLFVSHTIAAQATTKQQRLEKYEVENNIPIRHYKIIYTND
jgi:vancomycin permeability regulator SanA